MQSSGMRQLGTLLVGNVIADESQKPLVEAKPAVHFLRAVHPELVADAIVEIIPDKDYPLATPVAKEQIVTGQILINERSVVGYGQIVHRPMTMIAPLKQGMPVRLYLKQYPERSAYYLIGVFPAKDTASIIADGK